MIVALFFCTKLPPDPEKPLRRVANGGILPHLIGGSSREFSTSDERNATKNERGRRGGPVRRVEK